MLKNKLFLISISMLIVIALILSASLLLWNYMGEKDNASTDPNQKAQSSVADVKEKKKTAEQIEALTVEVKELTTNLADKDKVVRVSFSFELENSKTKKEFEHLSFKVKNIIIQTLADSTVDQIKGAKGQDAMLATLMNKINPILSEGKLKQIYITDWILQ
ncbi:flagellar basal body-associated FliL family protein [Paenibacillus cymbidii]|uniref:flagellar basal body-associated FliL family protein n=1 Tax=Paenibacillus cymbidii TaxID=1639034 RepID=UPI001F392685|nr:flagellar basal body-associated FliL family protein [Paenibacillus cymbidii]